MPSVPLLMPSLTPMVLKMKAYELGVPDALLDQLSQVVEVHITGIAVIAHADDADLAPSSDLPSVSPMPYNIACAAGCVESCVIVLLYLFNFHL